MAELKHNFMKGRMNKDLDERLVPQGEYRHAVNVEVATSESSNMGSLQTLLGNTDLSSSVIDPGNNQTFFCIGSVADEKNDKLYWLLAGESIDVIAEYDYKTQTVSPVVIDVFDPTSQSIAHNGSGRALNFDKAFLVTGINIIDDILFWTDNNTEPKRINIPRCKMGSVDFTTQTQFYVRDNLNSINQIQYRSAGPIRQEHLTVIKKAPPTAPNLEMINTNREDLDGDSRRGDLNGIITASTNIFINPTTGQLYDTNVDIQFDGPSYPDYKNGDILVIKSTSGSNYKVRVEILNGPQITPWNGLCTVKILGGNMATSSSNYEFFSELEQEQALFRFKFPRFAYRYKYEDGEYSTFSPFTEVAFLPSEFDYLPKEAYNLGMVNNLRNLIVKDFVDHRQIPDDVVSIDILYKESNSPNIYSVKTIKRTLPDPTGEYEEWNADSEDTILPNTNTIRTSGFVKITTEMVHAILPSNQLLRPYDNVPRKALGQEVVGNRLVYGNYLQNYNLFNSAPISCEALSNLGIPVLDAEADINIEIKTSLRTNDIGSIVPEQYNAKRAYSYVPAKSIKTLRHYQIGVVYIDEFGRETPVFSDSNSDKNSIYLNKDTADKQTRLKAQLFNTYPEWAESFKFYIKETSGDYYNLAMDRWYDAEDGNIWLSFPSSERNKLDLDTYLILKKGHNSDEFVSGPARYKVIAIENEAPQFIKTFEKPQPSITDTGNTVTPPAAGTVPKLIGNAAGDGFPLDGGEFIYVDTDTFDNAGWDKRLVDQEQGELFEYRIRFKSSYGVSKAYEIKSAELIPNVVMNTGTGAYKIVFKKELGSDVGITSLDGSYTTAIPTLTILLSKQQVLNKPEFQGRFFAKIKNDLFIQEFVIGGFGTSTDYNVVHSCKSQYISTSIPITMNPIGNGGGNWFGCDPGFGAGSSGEQKISIHEDNGNAGWPFCAGGPGHGATYWDHVSGQSTTTTSNGWFIDKIEGFRPFFHSDFWGLHDFKSQHPTPRTNAIDPTGNNECFLKFALGSAWNSGGYTSHEEQLKMVGGDGYHMGMQLCGTGEYNGGGTAQGYLGITDMRGPFWDNDGLSIGPNHPVVPMDNFGLLQNMPASDFGRIPPASGIHGVDDANVGQAMIFGSSVPTANYNVITLSKAGYGDSGNQYPNGSDLTSLSQVQSNYNMPNASWALDHVADMEFINSITTPGSIWRWREDPGLVVYRTKTPAFPVNLLMNNLSAAEWSFNQQDHMFNPSEKGVFLYNYANFADYGVNHHDHTHGTSTITHQNWVSQTRAGACTPSGIGDPNQGLQWHGGGGGDDRDSSGGWSNSAGASNCGNSTSTMGYTTTAHHRYPCNIWEWNWPNAKRRRYTFYAESIEVDNAGNYYGIGEVGPHYYSPTNDSTLDAHFDASGNVLTGTNLPSTPAPGIRNDGMHSTYDYPGGNWGYTWNSLSNHTTIPNLKRVDSSSVQSPAPGSVTWEVLSPYFSYDDENPMSTNPAIWETEPKEEVDLDIYYEVGQTYPIRLDNNTNEQFLGPIHVELRENSYVTCYDPVTGSTVTLDTHPGFPAVPIPNNDDIRVSRAVDNMVLLSDVNGAGLNHDGSSGPDFPPVNSRLVFTRANGSKTETTIVGYDMARANGYILDAELHNYEVTLPWHNCYSFGNGVESDRIRDDFNQVTIDSGAKASTVLEEPYLEERRSSGLIYSGIYNSVAGINNLNQFIQAEKITKDLNPTYGSIQKLHQRNFTLTTFCEDRVLKILANKDALYNADGNPQLISTNRVLGEAQPYAGEYGISKNPESFATENFRSYFTDKTRGAVLRLSRDGLTPISDAGMHDWFSDNLPLSNRIYGSFDDRKKEYNISLNHTDFPITLPPIHQSQAYAWVLANCKTAPCSTASGPSQWQPTNRITVDLGTNVQVGSLVKGVGVYDGAEVLSIQNVTYNYIDMLELELDIASTIIDVAGLGGVAGVVDISSPCTSCPELGYWSTRLVFYSPSETISTYTESGTDTTVSFSEINRGWVSFKSWTAENAISLNNSYYTIKNGDLWEHHTNLVRNNFHNIQSESSVTVMLNEQPGSVKSFQTLNYEGSQARITENLTDSGEYWDNYTKGGWYVDRINSDLQEGDTQEFKEKEGKWFSQLKGQYTEWTDDGTAGNLDGREFSFQGIGQSGAITTPTGGYTSWDCQQNVPVYSRPGVTGNEYIHIPGVNPSFVNYWFMNWQDPTFNANYPPNAAGQYSTIWIEMGPVDATFNPNPHYVNGVDNTNGHYMSLFGGEWANDTSTTIDGVLASTHPDYILYQSSYPTSMLDIISTSSSPNPAAYPYGHYITDNVGVNNPLLFTTVFFFVSQLQNQYGTFGGQLTIAKLNSGDLVWEQEFDASGTPITPIGVKDLINSVGSDLNLVVHHNQTAGSSMPSCVEVPGLNTGPYPDEPTCLTDVNSPCGLTGTSWECQPVTYACVNPNTGRNVIVQSGSSPDGHNRHGIYQVDCDSPQYGSGAWGDAWLQEYIRWFFDVPSRQTFRFEDYVMQTCGTDSGSSGGCIDCVYMGDTYLQGQGYNTPASIVISGNPLPPRFYTVLELINFYSTWYPVYPGMNYTQFLDATDKLYPAPLPNGVIGSMRFFSDIGGQLFTCPCPYTNCSDPQLAVTSTGFQCVELLGSTTGPHPDEATCIANSPSCAPIAPCTGTPHDITVFKTDATDPSNTGTCNRDGDAYIDVILLNGASTWTVEWYDATGTLITTDTNTYSGNTTSQSFVAFQASVLAWPPGFIDGDYYVRVTDNFGCFTDTLFTIDCIVPQPCISMADTCPPHTFTTNQFPATNPPICDNGIINVTIDLGAGCAGNVLGSTYWTIKWFEWNPTAYVSGTLIPTYVDGTIYYSGDTASWNPPDANRQWGWEICEHGGSQVCCHGLFGPHTPGCNPGTPHWSCCDANKPGYDAGLGGCVDWSNPNAATLVAIDDCFNDGSFGTGPNGPYYSSQSTCDSICGPPGSHFSYGCCEDPNGCNDVITSTVANVGTCYGVNGNSLPFEGQNYSFDPALTEAACTASCPAVIPSYDCCPPTSTHNCDDWSTGAPLAVLPGECYDPGNGLGAWTNPTDCDANCANVYGCTDPSAVNYCPTCTIDDGSCIFPITYNCNNGTCVNPGDGTGTYAALHLCLAACLVGSFPYYECNSVPACQGTNTASFTTYNNYNDCIDACGPPPPVWMCNGAMSVCQAVAVSNIPPGAVLNVDYFNDVMDCVPTCDYDCSVIVGEYHDMGIGQGEVPTVDVTPKRGWIGDDPSSSSMNPMNSPIGTRLREFYAFGTTGSSSNPTSSTVELNNPTNNWPEASWPMGLAASSRSGPGYVYFDVFDERWLNYSVANHHVNGAEQDCYNNMHLCCDYQTYTKCVDKPYAGAWQPAPDPTHSTWCSGPCRDYPYIELPWQVDYGHTNYPYNIGGITLHGPRIGGVGVDGSTHPWLATDIAASRPNGYRQSVLIAKPLVTFDHITGDTNYKLQAGHNYQLQITFECGNWTGGGPASDFGTYGYGTGPNQSKLWINTGHNADSACSTNSSLYASTHTSGSGNQIPHRHITNGVYNGMLDYVQRDWAYYNLGGGCPVMIDFPSWYFNPYNSTDYVWTYNFTAIGPTANDPTGSDRLNIETLILEFETYEQAWVQISNICIIEGISSSFIPGNSGNTITTSSTY